MLLFHSRQKSVINTTLPEERIRPAFAGVDLDRPLQSHAVSRLAQQRQQHDGQRAEQKFLSFYAVLYLLVKMKRAF